MQEQESRGSGRERRSKVGAVGPKPSTQIFLPKEVIAECKSFRDACYLAWQNRTRTNLTFSHLVVEIDGLHASHASEYFAEDPISPKGKQRRELPAKHVAAVQEELGNHAISQWLARDAMLTLMEEVITAQRGL